MRLPFGCVALLAAGCNWVAGIEDFVDAPQGAGGSGGEGSGGCSCVAEPVEGWLGPLVRDVSSELGACSAPYPGELARGGLAVAFEPASCGCSCEGSDVACSSGAISISATDGDPCDALCSALVSLPAGSCVEASLARPVGCVDAPPAALSASDALAGSWSGSCSPIATLPVLADPSWQDALIVCEGTVLREGCVKGETCVPTPKGTQRICIAREGEQACPSGPYSDRSVFGRAFNDTRDCEACSCSDGSCAGAVELFTTAECAGAASASIDTGDAACTSIGDSDALSLRFAIAREQIGCQPSLPTPTGEVTPSEPMTLCCLP